jgi:hypothetical protein
MLIGSLPLRKTSAGPMEASDVDCAAEAPQGGLIECLGQGWVGVDGPGHVLEKCPHFDRKTTGKICFH